jgi:hypothetical protein
MKLYVPEIGDCLKLKKEWKFKLYHEYRNIKLLEHFGLSSKNEYPVLKYDEVTLPKGTVLKVDRIYIRKGAVKYSSISFLAEGIGKAKNGTRFWAKLEECNQIEFDIVNRGRKKVSLWWRVPKIKTHQIIDVAAKYNDHAKKFSKTGYVMEQDIWDTHNYLYKVDINYTEVRELNNIRKIATIIPIFKSVKTYEYTIKRPDLEYIVKDKDGNLIGTYTNHSSMQKGIREHYNKS